MDIIGKGDFIVSNYGEKTVFTFRLPSLMKFDFIKNTYLEPVKNNDLTIGKNSKCPCGSGKKYKQCCGRV